MDNKYRVGDRDRKEHPCESHTRNRADRTPFFFLLVFLLAGALPAEAQHRITGRVTAAVTGEPLAGVQVQVRGTTVGALSNASGLYQVTAPSASGTLLFTRIGYAPREVEFDGETTINVELTLQATELEGIVVIGYGQRERLNLTESVGTVSAEEIGRVTIASPDQAIQGRVSGVQVTTESGIPGAPVAMRIRGVGTVGNAQPLFVVDGVPVGKATAGRSSPLATLNPNDIESISVLKDASAASVYGMQAANGVVLITTRRGTPGSPTIRYDGYAGVQRFPRYYQMNDSHAWLGLWQEALDNSNAYHGRVPTDGNYGRLHPDLEAGSPVLQSLLARNTDWTRVAIHNNAPIMNHTASVSGADDRVNYYVSAGYYAQDAIVEKWDLSRYTFRANSDFRVSDRVRFGQTFSLSNQVTLRGAANYGDGTILNNLLGQPPIFLAYDPEMVSPRNPKGLTGNYDVAGIRRANLNSTNQLVDVTDRTTRMLGGVHGEVDIIRGLTFRTQNSADYSSGNEYFWQNAFTNEMTGFQRQELAEDIRAESYGLVSTNTLNFNRSLGNHNVDVLAGVEANMFRNNGISIQGSDFVSQLFPLRRVPALGDEIIKTGGWAGEQNRLGYLGRLSYNYDDRYLLTASLRRDGVSTFAPGHQWGTFPAFSAGWRVSQEQFFNVPWINELKVRGGWGQLGNSEIPGGEYPQFVQVRLWVDYEIGGQVRVGPTPAPRLVNPGLTWETNETTDFGIETTLFNNALDLGVTWYRRDTRDFLVNVPAPFASGFTQIPVNVGNVRNQGLEFEAGYHTRLGAFDLNLGGNLTTIRNRLTTLAEGVEQYHANDIYRTAVGFPIGHFFGYKTCGVFQTGQTIPYEEGTTGGNQPRAGDMCFQDLNSRDSEGNLVLGEPEGRITSDDRTYLGKTIPDAYYGFNLNTAFRQFDLTAFFNGVYGVQRYNQVRRGLENMAGGGGNQLTTTQNRWTPENPSNTMPRAIAGDPAGNSRFSDRWVEDADYLRLRTLQLGYTLPQGLLGNRMQNARIYVSASNLWTVTGYSGLDPEFTSRGNAFNNAQNHSQITAGTDDGNVPLPRTFQIGVSTTF